MKKLLLFFIAATLISCGGNDSEINDVEEIELSDNFFENHGADINGVGKWFSSIGANTEQGYFFYFRNDYTNAGVVYRYYNFYEECQIGNISARTDILTTQKTYCVGEDYFVKSGHRITSIGANFFEMEVGFFRCDGQLDGSNVDCPNQTPIEIETGNGYTDYLVRDRWEIIGDTLFITDAEQGFSKGEYVLYKNGELESSFNTNSCLNYYDCSVTIFDYL